jgi:hypothetical protein
LPGEDRLQVDSVDGIPFLVGSFQDRLLHLNSGVVVDEVESIPLSADTCDGRDDVIFLGHVALLEKGGSPRIANLLSGSLARTGVDVAEQDGCPLLSHELRRLVAES